MPEIQTQPVSREISPTHELLTDEQLGGYLAGFGNSEGKSLLVLAMAKHPQGTYFSYSQLHQLLQSLAPEVSLGNERNQFDWCQDSLAPVGLVVKSFKDDISTFELTEEGSVHGKPLAGFLLDLADRHKVSLYRVFGATHSRIKEHRAPITRLRLMQHLLEYPGQPTYSSAQEILNGASKSALFTSLRALHLARLINYEAEDRTDDINPTYRAIPGRLEVKRRDTGELTRVASNFLAAHESADLNEIVAYITSNHPSLVEGNVAKDRHSIFMTLKTMVRRGKLERLDYKQQSEEIQVSLEDWQLDFWVELIDGLERFKNQDESFLKHCHQLANSFMANPERVSRALITYLEDSPRAGGASAKDAAALMLAVLQEHPEGVTARQATEVLRNGKRRVLSAFGARAALNDLVEGGIATKTNGKSHVYHLRRESLHAQVGGDV